MTKRRGHGEGTIYKVADDRWRGQAIILGKRRGVYGKTKKEAQQKLRKLLGDADRGLLPPPEKLTLEAYLERWFEEMWSSHQYGRVPTKDITTWRAYIYSLNSDRSNCR